MTDESTSGDVQPGVEAAPEQTEASSQGDPGPAPDAGAQPQWSVVPPPPGFGYGPPPPLLPGMGYPPPGPGYAIPGAGYGYGPPPPPPGFPPIPPGVDPSFKDKKLAAGLCGILLGSFGVHKFILGYKNEGLTMLLVSVLTLGMGSIVMSPIGLIEGIIYLTKSDYDFVMTYGVHHKGWF